LRLYLQLNGCNLKIKPAAAGRSIIISTRKKQKAMTKNETVFSKDTANKKLTVVREFDAPLDLVWAAWTQAEILDQWWAPKPYKAETKTMDFREGGVWLYSMVGPEGSRHWSRVDYKKIDAPSSITSDCVFCDENGNAAPGMPAMGWRKAFSQTGSTTTVRVELSFLTEADLENIIKMGFKEGFTAGLSNLDHYLSTQLQIHKQ
jgi:PhnB protein